MEILRGLLGVVVILGIAFLFSNNKKLLNYRLIISGLILQIIIGILVLKVPAVTRMFQSFGAGMQKIEEFGRQGAKFVLGDVLADPAELGKIFGPARGFIFAFNIPATIILVCVLVNILYYFGIMQRLVSIIAKGVHAIMGASGAETLSNVASAFVGQVEAQVMIRPYLKGMTKSELLTSMAGSMACIAGGVLILYINFGVPAEYLLSASLMAAPAAIVISKIVYPETEQSETQGDVKLDVKTPFSNLIDAISHGCSDGMKISMNVLAMLIGFIALIATINYFLKLIHPAASLDSLFGYAFTPMAWIMGVPTEDVSSVATLMGKKLAINEFVAYLDLTAIKSNQVMIAEKLKTLQQTTGDIGAFAKSFLEGKNISIENAKKLITATGVTQEQLLSFKKLGILQAEGNGFHFKSLSTKAIAVASFALCGFANFSSVGIQIGGIGELAPERKKDLAELGMKALLCGTLASYLSAALAGILLEISF